MTSQRRAFDIDTVEGRRPFHWLTEPKHQLKDLAHVGFMAVDHAAAYGHPDLRWHAGCQYGLDAYASCPQLFSELLPTPLDDWLPMGEGKVLPSFDGRATWHRPLPESFSTRLPDSKFTKRELAKFIYDLLSDDSSESPPLSPRSFAEPHLLIRLAYDKAHHFQRSLGVDSLNFQTALAAIGVGFKGHLFKACAHCYRRVYDRFVCCEVHSRSKSALRIRGIERSDATKSGRIAKEAADNMQEVNEDIHWCPRSYVYPWEVGAGQELEAWIGGVLWPLTGTALDEWRADISRALDECKLTASLLPAAYLSLPYFTLLDQLQAAVGTREWQARKWPALIRQAEAWLNAEQAVQETLGREDCQKRDDLAFLAREQKLTGRTQAEIAKSLGISASYLSKILSRQRSPNTDSRM